MATFETQVEALTGISIDGSSNPTQTELSSFLVDGVKEVVNRMIEVRPAELSKFTNTTNSASYVDKIGKILSVVREHDSTTILRKCTAIDPGDRYEATDSDSLLYRSKTNPGFYELDGAIYTVPTAGSGNNDIVVTQVHYDTGLVYGDTYGASNSSIVSFPSDYEYLVALYAAIKTVHRKMGGTIISITAVPPDVPTLSSSSVSFSQTAPTYAKESITTRVSFEDFWTAAADTAVEDGNPFGDNDPGAFSVTAVPPDVPTLGTSLPIYEVSTETIGSGTIDDEIAKMLSYIETEEDVELANAKAGEITLRLRRALEKFNADVAEYKTENEGELARYTAEISAYSADVNAQVQEYTQKLQRYSTELNTAYQAWAKTESDSIQEYQADIQQELNEFNKENAEYQAQLQISIKNADFDNEEDARKLQKYSAEQAEYAAEVTSQVQEQTTQVTQYQLLYSQLKIEYEAGFVVPGGGE